MLARGRFADYSLSAGFISPARACIMGAVQLPQKSGKSWKNLVKYFFVFFEIIFSVELNRYLFSSVDFVNNGDFWQVQSLVPTRI